MKVLVISAAFPPMQAGEATNTMYLCRYLADRGCDVHVLTSRSNVGMADLCINVHPIMDTWSWRELFRFRAFLKRTSPDAVLLMYLGEMYSYHPMITFAPTISKGLFPKVPFVTRFENAFQSAQPTTSLLVARAVRKWIAIRWAGSEHISYEYGTLLRDSDQIIALCELHRFTLAEDFPQASNKTVVIPPAPNIRVMPESEGEARRRGREILGIGHDEFLVAFLGYLYPFKSIETLLQACAILNRHKQKVRLVLIGGNLDFTGTGGGTYTKQMHELSKQLGIAESIIWTGAFKWDDPMASLYLYAADVGVLPFLKGLELNNSSFSCLLAHGLPIIATQGSGLDKQLIHDENVFLCPPRNAEAMADAIFLLMDRPDLRNRLGIGACKLAKEWFSWESVGEQTIETFSSHPCLYSDKRDDPVIIFARGV